MAHLNVYIFHCSRCGEPAVSLFKERTPGGTESQDAIFAPIDLKSIRAQCSACKHTQFRDSADAAHHELVDWNETPLDLGNVAAQPHRWGEPTQSAGFNRRHKLTAQ